MKYLQFRCCMRNILFNENLQQLLNGEKYAIFCPNGVVSTMGKKGQANCTLNLNPLNHITQTRVCVLKLTMVTSSVITDTIQ